MDRFSAFADMLGRETMAEGGGYVQGIPRAELANLGQIEDLDSMRSNGSVRHDGILIVAEEEHFAFVMLAEHAGDHDDGQHYDPMMYVCGGHFEAPRSLYVRDGGHLHYPSTELMRRFLQRVDELFGRKEKDL